MTACESSCVTVHEISNTYQQALDLVQQYEKMGSFDLEDRHGGRIGSESARISQEELRNKKYLVMNGMKKEGQGIDDIP